MHFPCMANHDRMSLHGEALSCSSRQLDNQRQTPTQEDPMDLDLHSPMPQGQFLQSQTLQKPRNRSGHFGTIQNPITSLTKPGSYQQQFKPSISSTSSINNASFKLSHVAADTQPQSATTEGQGRKRKSFVFETPSQPPSKLPCYPGKINTNRGGHWMEDKQVGPEVR